MWRGEVFAISDCLVVLVSTPPRPRINLRDVSWDSLRWGQVRLGEGYVDNILKLGYEEDCLLACTFCSFENNIYVCPVIWRTGMIWSGSVISDVARFSLSIKKQL